METETTEHRVELLGLLPEEVELFLRGLGQPAYRARQLFTWLHRGAKFSEMTELPYGLRVRLEELARTSSLEVALRVRAEDGTAKYAFRTLDKHLIESVFIPHADHTTVCVSSQIGCAFGCAFCATGQGGLVRSLATHEIVEQVVRINREIAPRRVRNVVFMGMGEPLANYEAVLAAIRLLNHANGLHIGARHITVSTCGLPEQIRRLAREGLQVGLAISLHGATDEVRSQLVPINQKHPLAEVLAAARAFAQMTRRKVAFEYVLVPGLNDTPEQAARLADLTRGLPTMVNLIPQNPLEGRAKQNVPAAQAFAERLRARGVEVAIRRSRGAEVLGACGQLRAEREAPTESRE